MIFKFTLWQLGAQLICCLSDYHTPTQPHNQVSNQHRAAIVQAAKANNAHVIVEDSYRYFDREPSGQQQHVSPYISLMQFLPKDAPLLGLSSLCYHAGVNATNVEFRLSITAAYNNGHATSKVLAHAQEAVERISCYDDGPIANAWYKKILDKYSQLINETAKQFFEQLRAKGDQPISRALLESIDYSPGIQTALELIMPEFDWNKFDYYSQKLNLLLVFELTLIDAELVHSLIKNSNTETIFICAGGAHISNIEPILEELGGTKIFSEGDDLIVVDKAYQEPSALSATQLSSLLQSEEVDLPFLLTSTLYVQSCFDCIQANANIRSLTQGLFLGLSTASLLSVLPECSINKNPLRSLLSCYSITLATLWYLWQPSKIYQPHSEKIDQLKT